jgi:hypothetical protein
LQTDSFGRCPPPSQRWNRCGETKPAAEYGRGRGTCRGCQRPQQREHDRGVALADDEAPRPDGQGRGVDRWLLERGLAEQRDGELVATDAGRELGRGNLRLVSDRRYSTARWQRFRRAVLAHYGHVCQVEGPRCTGYATTVITWCRARRRHTCSGSREPRRKLPQVQLRRRRPCRG